MYLISGSQSDLYCIHLLQISSGDDFPSATALMEAVFMEEANAQSQNPSATQNAPDTQTGFENSAKNADQIQNKSQSDENEKPAADAEKEVDQKKPNIENEHTEQMSQAAGSSGTSVQGRYIIGLCIIRLLAV